MTVCEANGWLFDLYAESGSMILWIITAQGERLRLADAFEPVVFMAGSEPEVAACAAALARDGHAEPEGWTARREFYSGGMQRVFAVRLLRAASWKQALGRCAHRFPGIEWFNADLQPEQVYGFERDTFPLMRCTVRYEGNRLLELIGEDDRWATGYAMPSLRVAELSGEGSLAGRRPRLASLSLASEGRTVVWDDPETILQGFQEALDSHDPDVILTSGGDGFLFPLLLSAADEQRFPLRLDRDDSLRGQTIRTQGRSYMSYGRVLYQAPEYPLRGRWHLDRQNSFTLSNNGLDGLAEVARLSRLPVQRIARRSIGTGISSVQLDRAWREGVLVPWKKTYPEGWKSAAQLLKSDRGGLVYAPETGFHEDVVELDFVAMYPSIMARFNISPETVNCPCCSNERVPEIGYTVCERRSGLVSRALAPIIEKRVRYKALRQQAKQAGDTAAYERWHARQDALKWMLVCCFGYLGYRNARFGRIEAHEAVSAYSREMLLRARETCEARGWRMLHANVDCVWIVKPGFREEEIGELCTEIEQATGLNIALEGIYRWLAFLPSRQVEGRAVPTRYFGLFCDGTLKYRGIECRRGDLPVFVKRHQLEFLQRLAVIAPTAAAYRKALSAMLEWIAELEGRLWRNEVPLSELAVHQSLSQEPDEYHGHGAQALAARQSIEAGIGLHAGERLSYLFVSDPVRARRVRLVRLIDADTSCDPGAYVRLLRRAMNTLLWPMGHQLDEQRITPAWEPHPEEAAARRGPVRSKSPQLDFLVGL